MGSSDFYLPGDWNAACYECGRKFKASELKKHWKGYYVCAKHWEARQPQDFVRGVPETAVPEYVQEQTDYDLQVCTINGSSGIPGYAVPGCMTPGQTTINPEEPVQPVPTQCDFFGLSAVPSFAMPGCATPGVDPFAP